MLTVPDRLSPPSAPLCGMSMDIRIPRRDAPDEMRSRLLALRQLGDLPLHRIGGTPNHASRPRTLLWAGSALDVGALLPVGDRDWLTVCGEGGSRTLASSDFYASLVITVLARRHRHVSTSLVLSQPGLVHLYDAVCLVDSKPAFDWTPDDIARRALAKVDDSCGRTVALYLQLLAEEAGNAALTFGASGGVFLGGGLAPALRPLLDVVAFRRHFESKGESSCYLRDVPVYLLPSA